MWRDWVYGSVVLQIVRCCNAIFFFPYEGPEREPIAFSVGLAVVNRLFHERRALENVGALEDRMGPSGWS